MYELNLPSLRAVNDMTWREFLLRKAGYERKELTDWHKTRLIAYFSGAGQSIDPKRSIESWMPLGKDKVKHSVSDETKARFRELQSNYLKKSKDGSK